MTSDSAATRDLLIDLGLVPRAAIPMPPAPSCPACGAVFVICNTKPLACEVCEWCEPLCRCVRKCDGFCQRANQRANLSTPDRETFAALGVVAYQPRS